jgi:hypothetical protein
MRKRQCWKEKNCALLLHAYAGLGGPLERCNWSAHYICAFPNKSVSPTKRRRNVPRPNALKKVKMKGNRKNSNYDMLGIFVQLCFNMGLRLEELQENHDELQEYLEQVSRKIEKLDNELQEFRNSLAIK